jgi:hypothetical protein
VRPGSPQSYLWLGARADHRRPNMRAASRRQRTTFHIMQEQAEQQAEQLTETQQLVEDLSLVTKLALQLPSFTSADVDHQRTKKGKNVIVVELSRSMEDPLNPGKMADTSKDKEKLMDNAKKLMLGNIGIEVDVNIVD